MENHLEFDEILDELEALNIIYGENPPVREARVLWERTNPLIELSDVQFR
jgi:hypothetical protein